MNGQWIGQYTGTNQGLLIVDLDDLGTHYEGSAAALDSNMALPPMLAMLFNVPKGQQQVQLRAGLLPIDRATGRAVSWKDIKNNYSADVTVPSYADITWAVGTESSDISWTTNVGTSGKAIVARSKSSELSELIPFARREELGRISALCTRAPPISLHISRAVDNKASPHFLPSDWEGFALPLRVGRYSGIASTPQRHDGTPPRFARSTA